MPNPPTETISLKRGIGVSEILYRRRISARARSAECLNIQNSSGGILSVMARHSIRASGNTFALHQHDIIVPSSIRFDSTR